MVCLLAPVLTIVVESLTMTEITTFLTQYGYLVIFVWVLADQAALPLPSVPILVTAGALAADGSLHLGLVMLVATAACLLSDAAWFYLGRRQGFRTLDVVCRLSIEPHTCVTRTKSIFNRLGPGGLVVAKYVPGLQTLAPAVAGAVQMPVWAFAGFDILGTLLWVVPFCVAGFMFDDQLTQIFAALSEVSGGVLWFLLIVVLAYVLYKVSQWLVFVRQLRIRRIEPEVLHKLMVEREDITIIDLRQRLDFSFLPHVIPGALRIPIDEIAHRHEEIPRDEDIVLYCT